MTPAEQAARDAWRKVMEIHYRHQRSDEKSNTAKWNLSAGEGWQIIAQAIEQAKREERARFADYIGHWNWCPAKDGGKCECGLARHPHPHPRERAMNPAEQAARCPGCGADLILVLERGGSTTDGHPLWRQICPRRTYTCCP